MDWVIAPIIFALEVNLEELCFVHDDINDFIVFIFTDILNTLQIDFFYVKSFLNFLSFYGLKMKS